MRLREGLRTVFAVAGLLACLALPAGALGALAEAPTEVLTPAEVVVLGGDADGQRVTVRGEAIGSSLRGGDGGTWVNVGQEGTAIGLWGEEKFAARVQSYGDYHSTGDIVVASGIYNAACDQHGGDRDVHFDSLEVVERGTLIERSVHWWKLLAGVGFAAGAGGLWFRYRRQADSELS